MRNLLRNTTVVSGGVFFVLKVPRIPLIVYLLEQNLDGDEYGTTVE